MERAPERKSSGASEAAAELGGEGTLVKDRGRRTASDTVPGDLRTRHARDSRGFGLSGLTGYRDRFISCFRRPQIFKVPAH